MFITSCFTGFMAFGSGRDPPIPSSQICNLTARWRRRPCVEALEDRFTPSFGDLLHTFHNQGQPPSANANFGSAVSLSGSSVLASYPNADSAELFDATTGAASGYIPSGPVVLPPAGNWGLSPSAISGNRVVIGEPLLSTGLPFYSPPKSGRAS